MKIILKTKDPLIIGRVIDQHGLPYNVAIGGYYHNQDPARPTPNWSFKVIGLKEKNVELLFYSGNTYTFSLENLTSWMRGYAPATEEQIKAFQKNEDQTQNQKS